MITNIYSITEFFQREDTSNNTTNNGFALHYGLLRPLAATNTPPHQHQSGLKGQCVSGKAVLGSPQLIKGHLYSEGTCRETHIETTYVNTGSQDAQQTQGLSVTGKWACRQRIVKQTC